MLSRSSALSGMLMKSPLSGKINSFDLEALSILLSFRGLGKSLRGADIIEINYPMECPVFLLTGKETKRVMHIHGPWLPPLCKLFRRTIDKKADMLITCSHWSRKTLEELYGITGVEVVHNGVDPDLFMPSADNGPFSRSRAFSS